MLGQKNKIYIDPMKISPRTREPSVGGKKGGKSSKSLSPPSLIPGALELEAQEEAMKEQIKDEVMRQEGPTIMQEAREEGLKEAYKEIIKEQRTQRRKLVDLLDKSNHVLLRIRNIIPIFTDEILIDANKITIINRPFFFSEHIQSISIRNVNDIFIQTI